MKPSHHYHEAKFRGLSPAVQLKAVVKLVEGIEAAVLDPRASQAMLRNVQECATWMDGAVTEGLPEFIAMCGTGNDPRELMLACAMFLQLYGGSRKDTDMPVRQYDGYRNSDPEVSGRAKRMIVILEDLRSVFNVGSIFRTAECLSLGGIWLCGITSTPDNPALGRTAMGTVGKVPWAYMNTALDAVRKARSDGYHVVAIETVEYATPVFESRFDPPLALVLGNESLGISDAVLKACDSAASIPVLGWKNSLNVGVAFAVAAYQAVFASTAVDPGRQPKTWR